MDRYNDEVINVENKTRTNKNQELYTDVYMNNVCVDIDNLKKVMKEDDYQPTEKLKLVKENKLTDVTYTDKEYNINILIEEAIKNKKDDNVKRSIDTKLDDIEIDNLIESINENKESRETKQEDSLLADLMPDDNNTIVVPPLETPILEEFKQESNVLDIKVENNQEENNEESNEESNEEDNEDEQEETLAKEENEAADDILFDEKNQKKVVLIVLVILFIVVLVIGFLIYKKIIKI